MKIFKNLAWVLLFSTLIFMCGCDKNKPLLFFYDRPVTKQTMNSPQRTFAISSPIYYALLVPKGIETEYIRVQIVKKEDKTNHWGYKIYQSRDFHIDTSKNYFINSFVIHESGYYFMQIFPFNNFDRPIARNDFWVKG